VTHILLARHGETEWNAQMRIQGHANSPLNARGHQQAELLAVRLAKFPLQAIYSSDLDRAMETAAPIAAAQNLDIIPCPALREKGYGEWEGLTVTEVEARYPGEWKRYRSRQHLDVAAPGGETWTEVKLRMVAALQEILRQHPGKDETILLVGHGGSLRMAVLYALDVPLPTLQHFSMDNTGLTRLEFHKETPGRVIFLNDTSHLEGKAL
jgi:broad specificity phosphatase PhoE